MKIAAVPVALPGLPPETVAWSPPARYQAVTCWEEFAQEEHRQTLLTKQVQTCLRPLAAGGQAVWLHTTAPRLSRKDSIQPVERLALRVAPLYEHVVVGMAPDGQFSHLLNYPQLRETWATLKAALLAEADVEDQLTLKLAEQIAQQVAQEDKVLDSLRHDYLYHALGRALSRNGMAAQRAGDNSREFPNFFPRISLWFVEASEVVPGAQGQFSVALRGVLDETKTDVFAIQQLMRLALALPADAALPRPHFGYEAAYDVEPATGLPLRLTLTVYARLAQRYNKQYTLTLQRLP